MSRVLKQSWHESFLECVKPHTDIPESFITWAALSLIGATLKNNVFFETGTYTLYPNQFIILVAPPGIGKGTAMDIVTNIINETKPNPVVNTQSDRITAEKMIENIATGWNTALQMLGQQLVISPMDHCCLIYSTEIRTLLGSSDWMLEFLEESWSKTTFDYQTKNKGSIFITDMCCSLLAASVPDFLRNIHREVSMAITGGFSSRCLFIYAEEPSTYTPWLLPLKKNPASLQKYKNLILDLKEISRLKGEFSVNTDAKILFEDFIKQNRGVSLTDDSDAVANFKARIKPHLLKLAMVLSASGGDSKIISKIDMLNAITEIKKVQSNLERLFRGSGESDLAPATARVQNILEKLGSASRAELIKATQRHITPENLDRILYVMETIGFCKKETRNKREHFVVIKRGIP